MESKENNDKRDYTETPDMIADSLKANGKNRKRENTRKTNRLWLWLGVLVLVLILLYWIFIIGTGEDMEGVINGTGEFITTFLR